MAEFQVVQRRGRKNRKLQPVDISSRKEINPDLNNEVDIEKSKSKLNEACVLMQSSDFFKDFKNMLSQRSAGTCIERIVSYGVGNFAECIIARYQLALLIALRKELDVPWKSCEIYDPKFLAGEKDILRDFGFVVTDINEEGKKLSDVKTLYHMLHCGKSLYNNLLWANWNPQHLVQTIIIGNSFRNMIESTPRRLLEKSGNYILKTESYVKESLLPENFIYSDIFNDTAILTFPSHVIKDVPIELWDICPEPQYDGEDIEFIPNK